MKNEVVIREWLDQGVSRSEIARRLGIGRGGISTIALRLGFPPKVERPSPYDWGRIREYHEAGHNIRECRSKFGFSSGAWERAVARGDVTPGATSQGGPPGVTREAVRKWHVAGAPPGEIAVRLGIAKPTVSYHLRRLGVQPYEKFAKRYDWNQIQRAHDAGLSVRECAKKFGFSHSSWHSAVKRGVVRARDWVIPLGDLLVSGRRTNRSHLKSRLVKAGLKQNRCERCGIEAWKGEALNMALHHMNGDGVDNRLENLRFLCPNCHSQTPNYGGRNGHRRPKRETRTHDSRNGEEDGQSAGGGSAEPRAASPSYAQPVPN